MQKAGKSGEEVETMYLVQRLSKQILHTNILPFLDYESKRNLDRTVRPSDRKRETFSRTMLQDHERYVLGMQCRMHMNRLEDIHDPDERSKYRKRAQCLYRLLSQFSPNKPLYPLLQIARFRRAVEEKFLDIMGPANTTVSGASKYYQRKFRILARRILQELASCECDDSTVVRSQNLSLTHFTGAFVT